MHRLTARIVAGTALAALIAVGSVSPAGADGAGGAVTDGTGVDYGAIDSGGHDGDSSSPKPAGGGSAPECEYRLLGGPENFPVYDVDGQLIEVTAGGAWYEKTCNGNFYGAVYLTGPPDAVDPAVLAAGALDRITVPAPHVALNPSGDQVVNLASWLWIPNWAPLVGTASAGGVSVQVTVRPVSARWSFGDGSTSTCAPGAVWSPTADVAAACMHTWLRSSASKPGGVFTLSVSVRWEASFTVTGGAGGGALDAITRTASMPVRVGEVQALNQSTGG